MNIKNYTSTVPASLSVTRIEAALVELGAERIHKGYKGKVLDSISFSIKVGENVVPFMLPAQVDEIEKKFNAKRNLPSWRKMSETQKQADREQAERTAWKLIYEWVLIQATMINLKQAEFMEVFLPYVYRVDKQQTFFKSLKESNYKALLN